MTALLTGLAAAEVQERAADVRERAEWRTVVDAARGALPAVGDNLPLEMYLRGVMERANVDSLTAKRALSVLRARHEALYTFGVGVYRPAPTN